LQKAKVNFRHFLRRLDMVVSTIWDFILVRLIIMRYDFNIKQANRIWYLRKEKGMVKLKTMPY